MRQTVVSEKVKARQARASRKARASAAAGPSVHRKSVRVQGLPAPVYNEGVLSQVERMPRSGGPRRRILMRGAFFEIFSWLVPRATGQPTPSSTFSFPPFNPPFPSPPNTTAENEVEEIYSVEHVRALGTREKEWCVYLFN